MPPAGVLLEMSFIRWPAAPSYWPQAQGLALAERAVVQRTLLQRRQPDQVASGRRWCSAASGAGVVLPTPRCRSLPARQQTGRLGGHRIRHCACLPAQRADGSAAGPGGRCPTPAAQAVDRPAQVGGGCVRRTQPAGAHQLQLPAQGRRSASASPSRRSTPWLPSASAWSMLVTPMSALPSIQASRCCGVHCQSARRQAPATTGDSPAGLRMPAIRAGAQAWAAGAGGPSGRIHRSAACRSGWPCGCSGRRRR